MNEKQRATVNVKNSKIITLFCWRIALNIFSKFKRIYKLMKALFA